MLQHRLYPLLPLYRLSKNPKRRQAVQLLQSVCCYLYHIAGISYYRQRDTYLFWMYEMVSDWITSDDENEETPTYLSEIKQAEQFGDLMEKKIFNHYNLNLFEVRLKNFKAKDTFDKDCYLLASKIFELYQHYPNTTIYQNLQSNSETEEYDRDTINMFHFVLKPKECCFKHFLKASTPSFKNVPKCKNLLLSKNLMEEMFQITTLILKIVCFH